VAVVKIVNHSGTVLDIAAEFGWKPGARYTNLRDIRARPKVAFLDIDWKNYSFKKHLDAARMIRPMMTVARYVLKLKDLDKILGEAFELSVFCRRVIVVPKDPRMARGLSKLIPEIFVLGYSVPTRYGGTLIAPKYFKRPVHLLGGRPDVQRHLAQEMPVISFDCNRFTLDARFGDYFDGEIFRPHPKGGYVRCLRESIKNITKLWRGYNAT
jgi:hypothetical protein